jgi:hypothetical protein
VEPFNLFPGTCDTYVRCLSTSFAVDGHEFTLTPLPQVSSLGLGELAEILGDVHVQMLPLYYGLDCRIFQTVSDIHVTHI